MDKRDAAGVLAQCKWLRDQIKRWEAAAKEVVGSELEAGERTAAIAPDGTQLGYVTRSNGKRSMEITNEDGFLAWVRQRYPTEVVQAVRPAFIKRCQEIALEKGALIDAKGEVCPHVSVVQGDPYPTVTLDKFAGLLIEQAIMQRKLMEVITPPSELEQAGPVGTVEDGLIDVRHETLCCCRHPDAKAEGVCPRCNDGNHAGCVGPLVPTTGPQGDWRYRQTDELGNLEHMMHSSNPIFEVDAEAEAYELRQDASVDPEPDLNDTQVGSPMWQDSNTFESDPSVRQKRGQDG